MYYQRCTWWLWKFSFRGGKNLKESNYWPPNSKCMKESKDIGEKKKCFRSLFSIEFYRLPKLERSLCICWRIWRIWVSNFWWKYIVSLAFVHRFNSKKLKSAKYQKYTSGLILSGRVKLMNQWIRPYRTQDNSVLRLVYWNGYSQFLVINEVGNEKCYPLVNLLLYLNTCSCLLWWQ